jgi:hypothetical protein
MWSMSEKAKQYIENCKRNGPQSENKPRKEALYPMHGCQIYTDDNAAFLEELKSLPKSSHDDSQDAAALASPPTVGILGAAAVLLNTKLKEKVHVDIPREPDIFKPTKSMLDILSEQIDSDLNKRLTEFGETNGFPVVFVFYQTTKIENGVSKATCDIKMYKSDEKQDARLFALKHAGEFGIFDPRSKDEQIKDLEKKVKRLEEDRDYWKREAEGDDDDTLVQFKHWDD